MAVQIPDPGTGNGQTGDNEYVFRKKVRDNFSDQTNAASRLMGSGADDLTANKDMRGLLSSNKHVRFNRDIDFNAFKETGRFTTHLYYGTNRPIINNLSRGKAAFYQFNANSTDVGVDGQGLVQVIFPLETPNTGNIYTRVRGTHDEDVWGSWVLHYTSHNTTVDSNNNIKTSSPVVRVFSDRLDKIHEANDLPIKYTRNGVGDYTIEGTTGLRENDWQIVIPKDDHDNQLIAFTIEDDNGIIYLKTYKRTFNMTTFMFEPDLSEPMDIPDGRWVDLHFNDLPQEQLDEPIE